MTEPEFNADTDAVLNRLLDDLIHRADLLEERLIDDKQERVRENAKRDRRIRWSRISVTIAIIVAVLALLVGYSAKATSNDIIDARTDSRNATCSGFEAFSDALINSNPHPASEEERNVLQSKIDAFESDMNKRLAPLGCHLELIDAPPVS